MFFNWRRRSGVNRLVASVFLVCSVAIAPTPLIADETHVTFDAPLSVACQDVTSDEFAASHSNEKLIEAKINISVLVTSGNAAAVDHLLVRITSPQRRLRVVDYQPRTELSSDLAGPVSVVDVLDEQRSINASLGGGVGFQYGLADVSASPSGNAGVSKHESLKQSFERLAPQQLLLASGTSHAGFGVFFKIRPSSQTSLEGDHMYVCRFAVPRAWRGDWIKVTCRAIGTEKDVFNTKTILLGRSDWRVGLHAVGDAPAQQVARQLVLAQLEDPQRVKDTSTTTKDSSPWSVRMTSFKWPINAGEKVFGLPNVFHRDDDSADRARQLKVERIVRASKALARYSGEEESRLPETAD